MTEQTRRIGKYLLKRWRRDFTFKTILSALGSVLSTFIFALYNGFLGVGHSSLWHGTICIYYLLLVTLRGTIIMAEKKTASRVRKAKARRGFYMAGAVLLLILNISLIVPVTLMVLQKKPVHLTLIPAITMAAYTTYKITMASVNLRRSQKTSDPLIRLLRTISFVDALVSILTLQNTLIMVTTTGDPGEMQLFTAVSSALILLMAMSLSVAALIRGTHLYRKHM